MAEVTGGDLRDHGLSKLQIGVINYARMMYVFGRDFFSIFKYYTAGIERKELRIPCRPRLYEKTGSC